MVELEQEKPAPRTAVEPDQVEAGQAIVETEQQLLEDGTDLESESVPTGVVRLLHATRIPPRFKKMVRAKVDGEIGEEMSLFTPCPMFIGHPIKSMADSAVETKDGSGVVLVIENHRNMPVHLKKGRQLGVMMPAVEVCEEELPNLQEVTASDPSPAVLTEAVVSSFTADHLTADHLTVDQKQKLEELIVSYADVFALDSSELGTTDIITHNIDTGDHRPIKQPIRFEVEG